MGEQQGWKELFLAQAFTQQHMESCSWLGAGLGMVLALGWSHSLFQACGDTCPEVSGRVRSWGSRGEGEVTVPLGCCALGERCGFALQPREAGIDPFFTACASASVPICRSCRGLLGCDTASSPGDSDPVTAAESRGTAGAAPRDGPQAELGGDRAGGELGHLLLSRDSRHPSCQGLRVPTSGDLLSPGHAEEAALAVGSRAS